MKKVMTVFGAVVLAVGLSACSSTSSSNTGSTQTTLSPAKAFGKAHGADVNALVDDMTTIGNDLNDPSVTDSIIQQDCLNIGIDAKILQADGPINDPILEAKWSEALSNLVSGASACVNGIATGNADLVTQSGIDFNNALNAIKEMSSITSS